ncbi:MAG: hypothetical protein ABI353_06030 [Isosphaeraceae bacterium]
MTNPAPAQPRRRRRRWLILLLVLIVPILGVILALPWALGTPPARRWLLARANQFLAPGGLDVATFRFSWFGPTVMTGFTIIDAEHDHVAFAPRVVWDRNLARILFDRPRYGTLDLGRANFDIERRADGSFDLYEALKPIFGPDPKVDLTIKVRQGTFKLRSPNLASPLTASRADLTIHRPPFPGPLIWDLQLSDPAPPKGKGNAPHLKFKGDFDRWQAAPKLSATLAMLDWPLAVEAAGVTTRGRFSGNAAVDKIGENWHTNGKAVAVHLAAQGPPLRGDQPQLDRVEANWNVDTSAGSKTVYEFALKSPVGSLNGRGALPDQTGTTHIQGTLDLAKLAQLVPQTLRIRDGWSLDKGSATLKVAALPGKTPGWDAEVKLSDLTAHVNDRVVTLRDPAQVSARLLGDLNALRLEHLAVKSPFLNAVGSGDVDQGIQVAGTFDLNGLHRQLGDLIDFGTLKLAGEGHFEANYQRTKGQFLGALTADVDGLHIQGPANFQRDSISIKAHVQGPATDSGLPAAWTLAQVGLASGDWTADVTAFPKADGLHLDAFAQAPLSVGRFDGHVAGLWSEHILTLDEVRVNARPNGDAAPEALLSLAGQGRFDPKSGSLVLAPMPLPLPVAESSAVGLAPDGLRVVGIGQDGFRADLAVSGDLAASSKALAAWTKRDPIDLDGHWASRWTVRNQDGLQFAGRVEAFGLIDPPAERSLALDLQGTYRAEGDRIDLSEIVLLTPFARLEASGQIEDLSGRRLADLEGRLVPDWKALNARLQEEVEPGARVDGRPGPVHLVGSLASNPSGDWLNGLDAGVGFDLTSADVYGLRLGPAPIAVQFQGGQLSLEPIRTSLNGGLVHLDPEIIRDQAGGLSLAFKPGSGIENAQINDEVSSRVLAFAAPVLRDATKVRGLISGTIDRAIIPLGADHGRSTVVEGKMVFQNVAFIPGPLSRDLLSLIGRQDATLNLDNPIFLSIANGQIYQRGLSIPIGRLARIDLEGTVGFDRTLDMRAHLPLTPSLAANRPVLGGLMDGIGLTVPIRGTLSEPKIDGQALGVNFRDLGEDFLRRGAALGGVEMFNQLIRPRDPNAPPPLTPQERRAQRLERRARRRGLIP